MGLSGSGKSTLLRAVNGLNMVARGAGAGQGRRPARSMSPRCDADDAAPICARSSVAMVFQQFALLPWRTVRENVGFGLELAGVPEAERERASSTSSSKLVGLDAVGRASTPTSFRAACSSASASPAPSPPTPPILLMDEPFSALDPLIRTKLQDELLQLQATLQEDHHLRQPRSRRGAEDRQPHRHHGGRPHRADRHAGGHRAAARQRLCRATSSPT